MKRRNCANQPIRYREAQTYSNAFTLVELLVVIAIIGVLVALLLPAVQAAREAARAMECKNHLRQIGVAMQHYHDAYQTLPYGSLDLADYNAGFGTWTAFILPFMEQQSTYDLFDLSVSMVHPRNRTAVTTIIDGLICPSDPQASDPLIGGRAQPYHNPVGSLGAWYLACMGPANNLHCYTFCPEPPQSYCCRGPSVPGAFSFATVGIFGRHEIGTKFADIPDGLAHTFLVGEGLPAQCAYHGAYHANLPLAETVIPLNHFTAPSADTEYYRACGFKSLHPGGAHFVMADGSAHFVSEAIDYRLYCALGTRDGGEVASIE